MSSTGVGMALSAYAKRSTDVGVVVPVGVPEANDGEGEATLCVLRFARVHVVVAFSKALPTAAVKSSQRSVTLPSCPALCCSARADVVPRCFVPGGRSGCGSARCEAQAPVQPPKYPPTRPPFSYYRPSPLSPVLKLHGTTTRRRTLRRCTGHGPLFPGCGRAGRGGPAAGCARFQVGQQLRDCHRGPGQST
eukprot:2984210-Rhodomonas_salina.2